VAKRYILLPVSEEVNKSPRRNTTLQLSTSYIDPESQNTLRHNKQNRRTKDSILTIACSSTIG